MHMCRAILFICFTVVWGRELSAQPTTVGDSVNGYFYLESVVVDGDTIPTVTLRSAEVSGDRRAGSRRYRRKWSKLQRNVVKTYPYAHVAGQLITAYNEELKLLETEAEREAYMDRCEDDLKAEFEGDLRKMTTSQGRVLIKLIDRQTGQTSYDLIRDLKSGFTAFMWQGVAKLFSTDLKSNYDPVNDEYDGMIEEIVELIEAGKLPVKTREVKTQAASEALSDKSKRLERRIEREKRRNERRGNQ